MQQPGQESYLRSGRKLVQLLVLLREEDRLDLVQPVTDPGKNLVLNLAINPRRGVTSTKRFERQNEQAEDIPRSGNDVGRPRIPQDWRTKPEDPYNVLYTVIKELVGDISLKLAEAQKVSHLPRDLSSSALHNGGDETRLVPCERVTEDLVCQLVETCGSCIPCITPRQVLPEMAQSKLEFDFCCRPLPRT